MIRALIFDFDGTLADTFPGVAHAWRRIFKTWTLGPLPDKTIKKAIGPAGDHFLKIILGDRYEALHLRALRKFVQIYTTEGYARTRLYAGVIPLLRGLHGLKIPMSIASNKPQRQVRALARQLKIVPYMKAILGPESLGVGKPDPAMLLACAEKMKSRPSETLMVGDTANDMLGGKNAGMPRAAALWGYETKKNLMKFNPEFKLKRPGELLNLIVDFPGQI